MCGWGSGRESTDRRGKYFGMCVCVFVCGEWDFFSLSYCSREVTGFYWISLILLNLILFGFIDIWLYKVQQLSEKAMATHSSTLTWKMPWMEEPGRLQSMGSGRVGQDWATSLSLFTFMHWRRKWQPTPVSLLENPRDWGAWWAAIFGVTQSQTWLKQISSSSNNYTLAFKFLIVVPLISEINF